MKCIIALIILACVIYCMDILTSVTEPIDDYVSTQKIEDKVDAQDYHVWTNNYGQEIQVTTEGHPGYGL